eukprot:scaffold338207_cov36-Prasinocladus_malaysianus.AAC.1
MTSTSAYASGGQSTTVTSSGIGAASSAGGGRRRLRDNSVDVTQTDIISDDGQRASSGRRMLQAVNFGSTEVSGLQPSFTYLVYVAVSLYPPRRPEGLEIAAINRSVRLHALPLS